MLDAREGNNLLNGGEGSDRLIADSGFDTMLGGAGADTLDARGGNDDLDGGEGDDLYITGSGADTVRINGQNGTDVVRDFNLSQDTLVLGGLDFGSGAGQIDASAWLAANAVVENRDIVINTGGGNSVRLQNVFSSSSGNSVQALAQSLYGDPDEEAGGNTDIPVAGDFSDAGAAVVADIEKPERNDGPAEGMVFDDAQVDQLIGTAFNDYLGGSDSEADTLIGGAGNDVLDGREGDNRLEGGNGRDSLIADSGDDTMLGGTSADTIEARGGDDWIDGGTGNDRISTGDGKDTVYIGAKNGNDLVTDFSLTSDSLVIAGLTFGTGEGETDPNVWLGDNATVDGRDIVVDTGDGNSVRLQNVFPSDDPSNSVQQLAGALANADGSDTGAGGETGEGGTTDPDPTYPEGAVLGTPQDDIFETNDVSEHIFMLDGDDTYFGPGGAGDTVSGGAGADVFSIGGWIEGTYLRTTITDLEWGVDRLEDTSGLIQPQTIAEAIFYLETGGTGGQPYDETTFDPETGRLVLTEGDFGAYAPIDPNVSDFDKYVDFVLTVDIQNAPEDVQNVHDLWPIFFNEGSAPPEGISYAEGYVAGTTADDAITPSGAASTRADSIVYGLDGDDTITGFDGNATLNGGAGDDSIALGTGNVVATGGDGSDTFTFDPTDVLDAPGTNGHDLITDFMIGTDQLVDTHLIGSAVIDTEAVARAWLAENATIEGGNLVLTTSAFADPTNGDTERSTITLQNVVNTNIGTNPEDYFQILLAPVVTPPTDPTYPEGAIVGTPQDDVLNSEADSAVFYGLAGNDILIGGEGDDTFFGGDGADIFVGDGYWREDTLGADVIEDFEFGVDKLQLETLSPDAAGILVFEEAVYYADRSEISGDNLIVRGFHSGESVTLKGVVSAEIGTDSKDYWQIFALWDSRIIDFSDSGTAVRADIENPERNTGEAAGETYDWRQTDGFIGTDFDDYLAGGADVRAGVYMNGGAGNDVLDGREGNNSLVGGEGDDRLIADSGSDTMKGGSGNDSLDSRGGDDWLDGGTGDDTIKTGDGADTVVTGADNGTDVITDFDLANDSLVFSGTVFGTAAGQTDPVQWLADNATVDARDVLIDLGDGNTVRVQNVFATISEDNNVNVLLPSLANELGEETGFEAAPGTDAVVGTSGNDQLYSSDDAVFALSGNDTIQSYGDDTITTGDGADEIRVTYGLEPTDILGNRIVTDFEIGVDSVVAPRFPDFPEIRDNDFFVNLNPGNIGFGSRSADASITFKNVVTEELGDDPATYFELIFGDAPPDYSDAPLRETDTLTEGDDEAAYFGYNLRYSVDGLGGNDLIYTGNLGDELIGGAGNDTLVAFDGDDTLTGGSGRDVFIYDREEYTLLDNDGVPISTALFRGNDEITDFELGTDQLDLGYYWENYGGDYSTDRADIHDVTANISENAARNFLTANAEIRGSDLFIDHSGYQNFDEQALPYDVGLPSTILLKNIVNEETGDNPEDYWEVFF